jgi:hypothetical protein
MNVPISSSSLETLQTYASACIVGWSKESNYALQHIGLWAYDPKQVNLIGASQEEKAYRWFETAKLYEQESESSSEFWRSGRKS